MIEDLKIDELNLCENVEPECKPVEPRARQKQEDQTDTDEWSDEGSGSAGDPLAVSPHATPESSHDEVDENKELQVFEPDKSNDACREPTSPGSGPPFDKLLVGQLAMSVPGWMSEKDLVDGAVELYQSFKPVDAMESVLARIAVGLTNATMDGLERAARIGENPEARQMELKLSQKGAATVVGVLTLLEKHRGLDRQKVSVGSVNVGSGGRAIVGHVQSAPTREEDSE